MASKMTNGKAAKKTENTKNGVVNGVENGDDDTSCTSCSEESSEKEVKKSEKAPDITPAAVQETFLGKRSLSNSLLSDNDAYMKRVREHDFVAASQENPSGLPVKLNEPTYTRIQLPADPWCDPNKPKNVQFQDISAAAYKIRHGIIETVCTAQKRTGVVAASAGNHALALSYHGQMLNIPVTVVMPVLAPLMKISLCRQYGANVVVQGNDLGESKEIAMNLSAEHGYLYINGYDHPHIISGAGTMGIEIVSQVENVDAVVVPVGGGGLIAGICIAVKYLCPNAKIYGVQSESCPGFAKSMEKGKPTYVKPKSTAADGLSVPLIGVNAFFNAHSLIDKIVTVSEEYISLAILRLVEIEKAVVEGAGAVGLAAMLEGKFPELAGKRVVIPLTGGNIDSTVLGRCIERGLAVDRRLIRFSVMVSDRPGGIAELASLLSQVGASIKDIYHERAWVKSDIFAVRVKVVVETRDNEHANELERALLAHYQEVIFNPAI